MSFHTVLSCCHIIVYIHENIKTDLFYVFSYQYRLVTTQLNSSGSCKCFDAKAKLFQRIYGTKTYIYIMCFLNLILTFKYRVNIGTFLFNQTWDKV